MTSGTPFQNLLDSPSGVTEVPPSTREGLPGLPLVLEHGLPSLFLWLLKISLKITDRFLKNTKAQKMGCHCAYLVEQVLSSCYGLCTIFFPSPHTELVTFVQS